MKHKKTKSKNFPLKRFLKVIATYFILYMALLGMVDYYAMMIYNFQLVFGASILLALVSGSIHIRYGKKSHIDDVANEIL